MTLGLGISVVVSWVIMWAYTIKIFTQVIEGLRQVYLFIYVWLNMKAVKFCLIKLATDF
jgi:hypothetical protein